MAMVESEGPRGAIPPPDAQRDVLVPLRVSGPATPEPELLGRVGAVEASARVLEADLAGLRVGLCEAESRGRAAEERARQAEEARRQAEQRRLEAERRRLQAEQQREYVERLLLHMRGAGVRLELIVGELKSVAARLRGALERPGVPSAEPAAGDAAEEADHRAQMADALAAAVERLRARVAAEGEPAAMTGAPRPSAPTEPRPPHKHSMSGLARWRIGRKQRRRP